MKEIIVDIFAGGGGASEGIEWALGACVDEAVNHNPEAIAMHKANHPGTRHHIEDVFKIKPLDVTRGRPVGLLWASPDCTHHSRAKGGKPVSKKIRGLAWIVVRWAKAVQPRVIMLENVPEFAEWGPLDKNDRPDKTKKGKTFHLWANQLRGLGYKVEFDVLSAADYGAPTIRKRLFMIARCDGQPIVWPKPTHGAGLLPYRTAAECIDWSLPCPSIFLTKKEVKDQGLRCKRPLADNTMRRIARGIQKYVIDAADPYIVKIGQTGSNGNRSHPIDEPLRTIVSKSEDCLVVPSLTQIGYGEKKGQAPRAIDIKKPLGTVVSTGKHGLVAAHLTKYHGLKGAETRGQGCDKPVKTLDTQNRFGVVTAILDQHYGGRKVGRPIDKPAGTVTTRGTQQSVVTAFLAKHYTGVVGADLTKPTPTVTAIDHNALVAANLTRFNGQSIGSDPKNPAPAVVGKNHDGLVAAHLTKLYGTSKAGCDVTDPMPTITGGGQHIAEVRAFLIKYYGCGCGQGVKEPMHTVTSKDRMGLVTIAGTDYQIADIGMRMLVPREQARAQGFEDSYILTGTKTSQTAKIGNSVCPPVAKALVGSNVELREITQQKVG